MTTADLLAKWPAIQGAFAQLGISLTLSEALALYPVLSKLFTSTPTPPPAPAPSIPVTLALGADANLAPYGVALIGFSPQDHQGADLRDPRNAKYIAYAYLVVNRIAPSPAWAPAAVIVLAAAVPAVPWQAADGETLVYGDEYIHVAPRGWGYSSLNNRADLDPQEFFWGSFSG